MFALKYSAVPYSIVKVQIFFKLLPFCHLKIPMLNVKLISKLMIYVYKRKTNIKSAEESHSISPTLSVAISYFVWLPILESIGATK